MTIQGNRTRVIGLFLLIAVVSVTQLHQHVLITVAAGCILGATLAIGTYSIAAAAILACPLALLTWVASTVSWSRPILGVVQYSPGDDVLSALVAVLLAGALFFSLIPYAAARWTSVGIVASLAAWIAGLLLTALAVVEVRQHIAISTEQGQYYTLWLTYNGLLPSSVTFHYQGQLGLDACIGVPARQSDVISIPADTRALVEQSNPALPDWLKAWYKDSDGGDPRIPCSTTVTENADRSIEVRRSCAATAAFLALANSGLPASQALQVSIPTMTPQGPLMVPGRDGILTVVAPRGCIATSYPVAKPISRDDRTETLQIAVGFPRSDFSLFEPQRMFSPPWLVQFDFLKVGFRTVAWQDFLRILLSVPGIIVVFLLAAGGTLSLLRGRMGWQMFTETTLADRYARKLAALSREALRRAQVAYWQRGRLLRWTIGAGLGVVALFILVVVVFLALVAFDVATAWSLITTIDPAFGIPVYLFFAGVVLIEIARWLAKRLTLIRVGSKT